MRGRFTGSALEKRRVQALGRLPAGTMNKTEKAYDDHLKLLAHAGEIVWHRFEGVRLKLADKTTYTPDFAVMRADGQIELHEVKGYWIDDAKVKIKVAADQYPFRFLAVMPRKKVDGGGWKIEEFPKPRGESAEETDA